MRLLLFTLPFLIISCKDKETVTPMQPVDDTSYEIIDKKLSLSIDGNEWSAEQITCFKGSSGIYLRGDLLSTEGIDLYLNVTMPDKPKKNTFTKGSITYVDTNGDKYHGGSHSIKIVRVDKDKITGDNYFELEFEMDMNLHGTNMIRKNIKGNLYQNFGQK